MPFKQPYPAPEWANIREPMLACKDLALPIPLPDEEPFPPPPEEAQPKPKPEARPSERQQAITFNYGSEEGADC